MPHHLTNFEIQIDYQNEFWFKGVYSQNLFTKIYEGDDFLNKSWWVQINNYSLHSFVWNSKETATTTKIGNKVS